MWYSTFLRLKTWSVWRTEKVQTAVCWPIAGRTFDCHMSGAEVRAERQKQRHTHGHGSTESLQRLRRRPVRKHAGLFSDVKAADCFSAELPCLINSTRDETWRMARDGWKALQCLTVQIFKKKSKYGVYPPPPLNLVILNQVLYFCTDLSAWSCFLKTPLSCGWEPRTQSGIQFCATSSLFASASERSPVSFYLTVHLKQDSLTPLPLNHLWHSKQIFFYPHRPASRS